MDRNLTRKRRVFPAVSQKGVAHEVSGENSAYQCAAHFETLPISWKLAHGAFFSNSFQNSCAGLPLIFSKLGMARKVSASRAGEKLQ